MEGWLEHRPSVYSDYLEDRNKLIEEFGNKKFYLNAISGNTNLSFLIIGLILSKKMGTYIIM